MKVCRKCDIKRDYIEYYKSTYSKDGYQSWCKKCKIKQNKKYRNPKAVSKYYQANKEKVQNDIKSWINNTQGVYGIWENGKCLYVGESKILKQRISQHKWLLKNPEKAGTHTSLYYNLQTHNHLIFGVIEECENHKEREQHFIDIYKPIYNNI